MQCLKEVELISTGVYLPGDPIPFDKIEDTIGALDKAPEKIKKAIHKLRSVMKGIIKTKYSYFAVDPSTKKMKENNADMAAKAIESAIEKAGMTVNDIDAIYLGIPVGDNLVPSTTPYIQQKLGIKNCFEMQVTSNCTSATKTMECALDALSVGRYKTAVVVYSQTPSVHLLADYYNQDKVTIENLLLRWFLSDGAAAVILKGVDKVTNGIRLMDTYNESMGTDLKAGMWIPFGASNMGLHKVYEEGEHHFGQDYGLVNEKAPEIGLEGFKHLMSKFGITAKQINHLIITLPSYSIEATAQNLFYKEISVPKEIWFSNVETKGYVGGAAVISSLNDLIENKAFKKGEAVVCFAVESSKWMIGGFYLKYI